MRIDVSICGEAVWAGGEVRLLPSPLYNTTVWFSHILEFMNRMLRSRCKIKTLFINPCFSWNWQQGYGPEGLHKIVMRRNLLFSIQSRKIYQNRHNSVQRIITNCCCQTLFTNAELYCLFRCAALNESQTWKRGGTCRNMCWKKSRPTLWKDVDHLVRLHLSSGVTGRKDICYLEH